MRQVVLYISIILGLYVFLQGCRKDSDTLPPVIVLTSPAENHTYDVFSEISIKGTVYDDQHLEYIRIQLLDEHMTPALPAVQITPGENNYTLNQAYVLDDVLTKTGKYYLQVQANDGVQLTNKYVTLQITAAPKKLKYFVVVTKNGNELNVVKVDSAFQTSQLFTVTSDYLGSGVFNNEGLFYLGGSYTGDIVVYDMSMWQEQWEVPVTVSPPFAWFTGMMVSDGYLWAGYQTGKFEKYNLYGYKELSVNTMDLWAPRKFCLNGDKLIVEEKRTTGPEVRLTVRFEFSGAIDGQYPINETTVALWPVDANNLCHLTNSTDGQSHLYLFNTDYLFEEEVSSAPGAGKAWCAIPAGNNILIGHDEGIYRFSPESLTTTLWIGGVDAHSLFLDETHGWLLAGQGKQLKIFLDSFPSVTAVQTVTLSDSIVAVHGIYNKD